MSKSSDTLTEYNKARSQLQRAITIVEQQGYEAYTQMPDRVKEPTDASIRKIKHLTDMVWDHSFKIMMREKKR